MADSNVNIQVDANTSSAVGQLSRLNQSLLGINKTLNTVSANMYKVGHTFQEFGQNMYSIGQRATIGLTAPLAGVAKSMIETGASMKAMHNTFKLVFGDMTAEAQAWSKELSKSVGLSSGIIDETNLQFRKMAGAFGLTGKQALDFSEKWTKLTMDVSAFNDIPIADATERMMSGLRGEADAVEKLGIFMGEANLKQQMMTMGIKGQYHALDQATRMEVLYTLAMKQTAQAQGQASREAQSYQNSIANLKQTYKEFSEVFFVAVEPAVQDMLKQLTGLMEKLKELSPEQIKFYANVAKWLIIIPPIVMYLGATVEAFGRLWKVISFISKLNIATMLLGIKSALETLYIYGLYVADGLAVAFSAVGSAFTAMAGVIGISVGWLIAIIAGIVIAVALVIIYWDEIKAWTIKTWGKITVWLSKTLADLKANVMSVMGAMSEFIKGIWAGIVSAWNTYLQPIINVVVGIFNSVISAVVAFGQKAWAVLSTIGKFFVYVWMDLISPILQFVGGFFTALGELVVWCFQQVIGKAIGWLVKRWLSFYFDVVLPVGTAINAVFTAIGNCFTTVYNGVILPILNALISTFVRVGYAMVSAYYNYVLPVWNMIKAGLTALQNIWNSIMTGIQAKWTAFVTALRNTWNSIATPVMNTIKSVINGVLSTWNSVWNRATITFNNFIAGLRNAWAGVKSIFKLPHISITGSWDLTPPSVSVPKFGINWYKKGGFFTDPSVIGVAEAGDEAVLPLTDSKAMSMLGAKVAEYMPDSNKFNNNAEKNVVINVKSLVVREEADVEKIGQQLYKLHQRESRRYGRSNL